LVLYWGCLFGLLVLLCFNKIIVWILALWSSCIAPELICILALVVLCLFY
jgi:hypothetical protein